MMLVVLTSPITTGIGYFAAAMVALHLTRGESGIAALWPPSGILFAALFVARRERVAWHLIAAGIASLLANLSSGNPLLTALGFTVANLTESAVSVWLLRTQSRCRVSFTAPAGIGCFGKVAVIGPALSATMATCIADRATPAFWFSWFSTDVLGILIVTPLILIASRALTTVRAPSDGRGSREAVAVFALVAGTTAVVFAQSRYPLLFVPMLAMLVAVFRLGPVGAAGGVLIVAIVSSVAVALGSGPQLLIHDDPLVRSLFLQFYLLALLAAALPIAALLAARGRLVAQLAEQMRLLQLAESTAQVGHWRLDVATQRVTWSQEVFRIHGLAGGRPPSLDQAINAYHPDDRAAVSAEIERAIEGRDGFSFTARIIRPNGEVRTVLSRGEIDRVEADGSFGLFGVVQDISVQVAHEAALEQARVHAEQAAREAMVLAETDPLTGIANRRRTMLVLDRAIAEARLDGRPLSIAMFDIDHFKRINDRYGHHGGDAVLRRVAGDAGGVLRRGDTIGRIGGEEFVMILPGATAQTAMAVAERARAAIVAGGDDPRVTISVGVAELLLDESVETLLHRTDQALYAAKDGGRNTLRLAA